MNKSNLRALLTPDSVGISHRVRDDVESVFAGSDTDVSILGNVFARYGE